MLANETYTKFRSHTSYVSHTYTCMPIIMHCPGQFVVVYKQISTTSLFGRRISTFLQNFITVVFELSEGGEDEQNYLS